MKDNIHEVLEEYMQICEQAFKDGCSEDVNRAWEQVSSAFGHEIPDFYDCLNGPDSPTGDMRRLDLPLIIAKLRIYGAKLEYGELLHKNDDTISLIEHTKSAITGNSFNRAIEKVVDDDAFTNEEKSELFDRIHELQSIAKNREGKAGKWEKIKTILLWLGDKDVIFAYIIIPLISESIK